MENKTEFEERYNDRILESMNEDIDNMQNTQEIGIGTKVKIHTECVSQKSLNNQFGMIVGGSYPEYIVLVNDEKLPFTFSELENIYKLCLNK